MPGAFRTRGELKALALFAALSAAGCSTMQSAGCGTGAARSVSDLMYFGTDKPTGGSVSQAEWNDFLQGFVTPRFPQGLTVWPGAGQWLGADGAIVREPSFVVSLFHPDDEASERAVQAIAAEYKLRFAQEAVLRVRSEVCVSY